MPSSKRKTYTNHAPNANPRHPDHPGTLANTRIHRRVETSGKHPADTDGTGTEHENNNRNNNTTARRAAFAIKQASYMHVSTHMGDTALL